MHGASGKESSGVCDLYIRPFTPTGVVVRDSESRRLIGRALVSRQVGHLLISGQATDRWTQADVTAEPFPMNQQQRRQSNEPSLLDYVTLYTAVSTVFDAAVDAILTSGKVMASLVELLVFEL